MTEGRVVITGLGVIAPNGIGKQTFWENLVAGSSAVDVVNAFDATAYPCKVAAEVRNFRPEEFMHPRRVSHRGRFSQLAVAAAKLAVEDSGLDLSSQANGRAVVCIGTSLNGSGDVYEVARVGFDRTGVRGIPITSGVEFAAHAPASHVSVELGLRGQAMTLASACSTGLDVIQWSCSQIADGHADVVLAGSTDAPIFEFCFATLCALGSLSNFSTPPSQASRPYDLHRDGLVLGEGAVIYILESLEHACRRDADVYAEVLDFGSGNEGGFGTKMDAAELALADAIQIALDRAQILESSIDYINAHGNALPDYDLVETRAFKRAFGAKAYNIPVSSIKSMIGHAMGAGSAFQVAAACLALRHAIIPPTINLATPDPDCDLDYVPRVARRARLRNILINAHAMGGSHSVLILGAPE